MAEWLFRRKSKNEVERDPGWDEYFTSNRSTDESLVREAIQNSLDAHARVEDPVAKSQPAFVRFFYSSDARALPKAAYEKYLGEDRDRIRAWIDSAVASFVKNRNLTQMANEWEGE